MIRPSLLRKMKDLTREMGACSDDVQLSFEPMIDSFLLTIRSGKQLASLKVDVLGTVGRILRLNGK